MKKLVYFLILSLFVFAACEKEFVTPLPKTKSNTTVEVKFSTDIAPIFSSASCNGCHSQAGQTIKNKGLLNAANLKSGGYATTPGSASGLINTINGGHNSGLVNAVAKQKIISWVDAGAKDN